MKISFITTVFKEEKTIERFLDSLFLQTTLPHEIIIVDGGNDNTGEKIKNYLVLAKKKKIVFKYISKKGNRSVGRNTAIKNATGEIIVCSDSGNILDRRWIENIIKPFKNKHVDVVAGYYKGKPKNIFQKCLIPFALVMPDKVNSDEFLPATRSVAFTKSIWKRVGGFDEKLSHNEDYLFANRLKEQGAKIFFAKDALVYWLPRNTFKEAFIMFFRFAFGDAESHLLRDKVILVFARYLFYLYLIVLFALIKSPFIGLLLFFLILAYIVWSVKKNYKYVSNKKALLYLPLLQITADFAVLFGTSLGYLKIVRKTNYKKIVKENFIVIILLSIYVLTMLSIITSGIPNQNHPFTYQMDEWHQSQSVRNVFKHGTPNMEGSANGTMFNFFLTGIMLIPFYLTKIINPFAIKSSVDALSEQTNLFVILRLTTLFWGVLTLVFLQKIAKLLQLNKILVTVLFIFTPVWLVLSNFFKYDIALTFWIVVSLYYFIKYSKFPTNRNFLLGCFFSGVAFAVKVSAIPLLPIIFLAYLLFTPKFTKKSRLLFGGIAIYFLTAIFLGIPDLLFGKGNMTEYLNENILGNSKFLENFILTESLFNLTVFRKFPAMFGHLFYIFNVFALVTVVILAIRDLKKRCYQDFKLKLFLLLSFIIFCSSLVTLGITISANRSVVLLPFMVIFSVVAIMGILRFINKRKELIIVSVFVFITGLSVQIFESYQWVKIYLSPSPQQVSSEWFKENIKKGATIGLENVPIYQFEPDYILKEFYDKQYHPNVQTTYNYLIVDPQTKDLPEYMILSNVNFEKKYLKNSSKNDLVTRINREGYKQIAYFPLTMPHYKYFDNYFYYPSLGLFIYPDGISVFKKTNEKKEI